MLQLRYAGVAPASPPPFRALADTSAGLALTRVSGELDSLTAPRLELLLESLAAAGHTEVVLDLVGLRFVDGVGLDLLVKWTERMRKAGGSFRLRRPPPYLLIVAAFFQFAGDLDIEPLPTPSSADEADVARAGEPPGV